MQNQSTTKQKNKNNAQIQKEKELQQLKNIDEENKKQICNSNFNTNTNKNTNNNVNMKDNVHSIGLNNNFENVGMGNLGRKDVQTDFNNVTNVKNKKKKEINKEKNLQRAKIKKNGKNIKNKSKKPKKSKNQDSDSSNQQDSQSQMNRSEVYQQSQSQDQANEAEIDFFKTDNNVIQKKQSMSKLEPVKKEEMPDTHRDKRRKKRRKRRVLLSIDLGVGSYLKTVDPFVKNLYSIVKEIKNLDNPPQIFQQQKFLNNPLLTENGKTMLKKPLLSDFVYFCTQSLIRSTNLQVQNVVKHFHLQKFVKKPQPNPNTQKESNKLNKIGISQNEPEPSVQDKTNQQNPQNCQSEQLWNLIQQTMNIFTDIRLQKVQQQESLYQRVWFSIMMEKISDMSPMLKQQQIDLTKMVKTEHHIKLQADPSTNRVETKQQKQEQNLSEQEQNKIQSLKCSAMEKINRLKNLLKKGFMEIKLETSRISSSKLKKQTQKKKENEKKKEIQRKVETKSKIKIQYQQNQGKFLQF